MGRMNMKLMKNFYGKCRCDSVRSTDCFFKGSWASFLAPTWCLTICNFTPENLLPSSGSANSGTHVVPRHTRRKNTQTHKITQKLNPIFPRQLLSFVLGTICRICYLTRLRILLVQTSPLRGIINRLHLIRLERPLNYFLLLLQLIVVSLLAYSNAELQVRSSTQPSRV